MKLASIFLWCNKDVKVIRKVEYLKPLISNMENFLALPCLIYLLRNFSMNISTTYDKKIQKKKRCFTNVSKHKRVTRIELATEAWEASVLPLNYTRTT